MKVIIDRFEGDLAIVEMDGEQMASIPKVLLPEKAKEGTVISIEIDQAETDKRKENISKLMDNLFKE